MFFNLTKIDQKFPNPNLNKFLFISIYIIYLKLSFIIFCNLKRNKMAIAEFIYHTKIMYQIRIG